MVNRAAQSTAPSAGAEERPPAETLANPGRICPICKRRIASRYALKNHLWFQHGFELSRLRLENPRTPEGGRVIDTPETGKPVSAPATAPIRKPEGAPPSTPETGRTIKTR